MRNVRLQQAAAGDRETVPVRFDYDGGANTLGNAMSKHRRAAPRRRYYRRGALHAYDPPRT